MPSQFRDSSRLVLPRFVDLGEYNGCVDGVLLLTGNNNQFRWFLRHVLAACCESTVPNIKKSFAGTDTSHTDLFHPVYKKLQPAGGRDQHSCMSCTTEEALPLLRYAGHPNGRHKRRVHEHRQGAKGRRFTCTWNNDCESCCAFVHDHGDRNARSVEQLSNKVEKTSKAREQPLAVTARRCQLGDTLEGAQRTQRRRHFSDALCCWKISSQVTCPKRGLQCSLSRTKKGRSHQVQGNLDTFESLCVDDEFK